MQLHWGQVKEFIRREWPKISESALDRINGDFDLFLKYLIEAYDNYPLEEAKALDKLQRFLNSLEEIG